MTLLLLLLAPAQFDPATRFELGLRLQAFERALDRHKDADTLKRALPPVARATPAFFSGQLGEAGKILDTARLALADPKPDPARLWASSLSARPSRRVTDAAGAALTLTVGPFYKAGGVPEGAKLRWTLTGPGMKVGPATLDLATLPVTHVQKFDRLPEGDYDLVSEVVAGGAVLATTTQTVSFIERVDERLEALKKLLLPKTVEGETCRHLRSVVADLAAGKTLEANYPAHRLLAEAEALAKADRPYYTADRPGQFWLALPGVSGSPVRVQVPAGLKKGAKVPVVVALHGAGGSENMFFDGYGDGLVARLAAKRGWVTVAPRSGFFTTPDVPAVVDALARAYPLDAAKVFVVGHSMGAAQAARAAGQTPERFAAAACLGGGGGVRPTAALKKVPFFLGVGKLDFALTGSKRLADGLKEAGVEKLVYRVYDDVEHLTVVQLALPEVFAFFDEEAKR
ncbi:MAG: alpha/beta fold hydrolase [Gemmataceae bacterium]